MKSTPSLSCGLLLLTSTAGLPHHSVSPSPLPPRFFSHSYSSISSNLPCNLLFPVSVGNHTGLMTRAVRSTFAPPFLLSRLDCCGSHRDHGAVG
ncbi:hypothetical protein BR93DRAFT_395812 [Coniochaeta sp. PMI_546]|nr:hypothetical protein BR93DRAFT_395812 [Coniochaeta sp. PMI_546]